MRKLVLLVGGTLAGLAAVGILGSGAAFVDTQSTITKFSGQTTTAGTWTRTITDVTEPNGPGSGVILVTHNIVVNYAIGQTDEVVAANYRNACLAALPSPATGDNGYGAVFDNGNKKHVRLSKQKGTYKIDSDVGLPTSPGEAGASNGINGSLIGGLTVTTDLPGPEDAPLSSPAALASLMIGLAALAYWARHRRASA